MSLDPSIIGTADPSRHTPPPLLKHSIMLWLQKNPDAKPDTLSLAKEMGILPGGMNRALWDLKKNGLATFKERKHRNGGGNTTHTLDVMADISLTQKGKDWRPTTGAIMGDLVERPEEDAWNPDFVHGAVAESIAEDMGTEATDKMLEVLRKMPPAKALETVLRARGKPIKIRSLNVLLGYHAKSTALYSLVRFNPEAFHITNAYVHLDAPEGWEPKAGSVNAGRHRAPGVTDKVADFIVGMTADGWHKDPERSELWRLVKDGRVQGEVEKIDNGYAWQVTDGRGGIAALFGPAKTAVELGQDATKHTFHDPLTEEARASVALDGETQSVTSSISEDVKVIPPTHEAPIGPLMQDLMSREQKRAKVAEAVAALEAAGLDEVALTALAAIPDDTPLEAEVVAFLKALGWGE